MAIYIDDDFPAELRTTSGSKNYKYEMSYVRRFQVRTTAITDTEEMVLTWMQINENLYVGRPYPNNPYAYCTSIDWEAGEPDATGGRIWILTYNFSTFPYEMLEQNPLLRPYTIDWDSEEAEEGVRRDFSGTTWAARKDVANSAGLPFDPPITRPITYSVLRVVRNEAINTYDEAFIQNYRWSVNDAEWDVWIPTTGTVTPGYITIPARCALCASIKPTRVFSQTLQTINADATLGYYLEVEYLFKLKFASWGQEDPDPDKWVEDDIGQGWDKRVENLSDSYLDGSGNRMRATYTTGPDQGKPLPQPVFLDENGAQSDKPTYRTFQVYPRQNFDDFGFVMPTP